MTQDATTGQSRPSVHRAWPLTVVMLASMLAASLASLLMLLVRAEVPAVLGASGATFATSIGIGFAILHFMTRD
ncbi:hypothetical protein AB0C29_36645 [Actinoplanes sp. NPDC048791]|uniref:hypothetical protein n=1 Tax=Actinoplanes sp. NPDC048791 TaxID=3154623 RepID=UPI0033ED799E